MRTLTTNSPTLTHSGIALTWLQNLDFAGGDASMAGGNFSVPSTMNEQAMLGLCRAVPVLAKELDVGGALADAKDNDAEATKED